MKEIKLHIFPRKWVYLSALICALLLVLVFEYQTGHADIAPPKSPPGANPDLDTVQTNVRMVEEKVVIEVQQVTDLERIGTAKVQAEFQMKNLGSTLERLMVRFPIAFSDGAGGYPEIMDMHVYVDNASVQISKVNLEGEPQAWDDPVKWAEFEVSFPPDVIVGIEVNYTLKGTGEYPFVSYEYLLETGAGWQGTIGSAEITVRLPYLATEQTVFIDSSPGWGETTPGAHLNGKEVSWYFEDFEPGYENNISIALVWPSAWYAVEQEQSKVRDHPNDGEAWGRLGKRYKEVSRLRRGTRYDAGGQQLFDLSKAAYLKALELLPDDALWHAGYADLLVWNSIYGYIYSADDQADLIEGLRQMWIAYTLDPAQPYIQDYLSSYTFPREAVTQVDGGYVFYWLTQTPTLFSTSEATETQIATQKNPPTATVPVNEEPSLPSENAQTPIPASETEEEGSGRITLPVCGSAILFPLAFGVLVMASGRLRKFD